MMKNKINISLLALSLGLVAVSCSDSSDWQPGPADNDCGVKAYFPVQSKSRFVFATDNDPEDMNMAIEIARLDATEAVSFPLTLTSDTEGFSGPSTVDFAAGETTTTININCSGIPEGSFYSATVSLPADQTDIYGPGVIEYTVQAIISDWTLISDDLTYYYMDNDYNDEFPSTYGEIYHLQGSNYFRFTDFFASGVDIEAEVNTGDEMVYFYPMNNYVSYYDVYGKNDGNDSWYIFDDATDDYPAPWSPGNDPSLKTIDYARVYGIDSEDDYMYTNIFMLYDPDTLYGYGNVTIRYYFTDGSNSYGYNQMDFTLKYNPFK